MPFDPTSAPPMPTPDTFAAPQTNSLSAAPPGIAPVGQPTLGPPDPYANDQPLLDLFDKLKKESTEYRYVWEREWLRDLFYVANRQWISYNPVRREWVDKKVKHWVPKPVTNKMAETVQAIRATLNAINMGVTIQPVGSDPQCMAAAEVADQLAPLIHEEHLMPMVLREADFWFITTGNACLQVSWDNDARFNKVFIPYEMCLQCQQLSTPKEIVDNHNMCPKPAPMQMDPMGGMPMPPAPGMPPPLCNGQQFQPAIDPESGSKAGEWKAFGRGKTTALSPFEWAVPPYVTRFDELPYLIRLRWRDRAYYEANLPDMVSKISWEKSPSDRSMQILKSLSLQNNVGGSANFSFMGATGTHTGEGIVEYELWFRATPEYPEGLIMRVCGDKDPLLLRIPEESIPGPMPFKDIEGKPLWPFVHAQYEHMGGRLYGRSALSPLIQKQDQLNQLDSLVQLIVQRMANPVWIIPEGAGIENITGEPGLVLRWNPLAAGGNAMGKPERIAGLEVPASLAAYREQIIKDIEELSGAFDIIKGQKPTGVEAFSALQLLVERSQSRFGSAFSSRGEMYRKWFGVAIELERSLGPEQRTKAVTGANRGFTFRHFQNSQLQAQIAVKIEDGNQAQKTNLGKRAAIEQANQMGLINPQDPDQQFAILSQFGLSDLVPTLNIHVQSALQLQDAFEMWAGQPIGPPPLVVEPWFDPMIHFKERVKWLNSDRMREMLAQMPNLKPMIYAHLQQLQMLIAPPVQIDPKTGQPIQNDTNGAQKGPPGAGGAQSMSNSNKQSGSPASVPSGNSEKNQKQGPM